MIIIMIMMTMTIVTNCVVMATVSEYLSLMIM